MKRRELVVGAAATGFAGTLPRQVRAGPTIGAPGPRSGGAGPPPNILLIIVDQMRYPSVFPAGITHVSGFLAQFMPNLYKGIWTPGVKFTGHYSAASPCSPARAAFVTGLYSHQSWLLSNLRGPANSRDLALQPSYPTYGKLLRAAGYQTPFIGKWHLSQLPKALPRLEEYGFDGLTYRDPIGKNLEGTVGDAAQGFRNDQDIANQATVWLSSADAQRSPWCLTVSFINPHDIEFFWGGTEFRTYNQLFDQQSALQPKRWYSENDHIHHPPVVPWGADPLKQPPSYGYPAVPPNWESASQIAANKPSTQAAEMLQHQLLSGGISEDPQEGAFTLVLDPGSQLGIAKAPYSYWQRGLDCYTQLMSIVDARIGEVLAAIPPGQAENTVLVFTADHGNYSGAHGFMTGKTGALYDEAFHVPLVVADPSGRFTGEIGTYRAGLTSSVDILPMLVGLGHNGGSRWQSPTLEALYGGRHDMLAMLKSVRAPGRDYVLLASDDGTPTLYAENKLHLLGLRTPDWKLGTYSQWHPGTARIMRSTMETEFYNYSTAGGRLEIDNTPDDPRAAGALAKLLDTVLPNEQAALMPGEYAQAQANAKAAYLAVA